MFHVFTSYSYVVSYMVLVDQYSWPPQNGCESRICFGGFPNGHPMFIGPFDPPPLVIDRKGIPLKQATSWILLFLGFRLHVSCLQGVGTEPEGDSRKETTSWMVYRGHSISHSLHLSNQPAFFGTWDIFCPRYGALLSTSKFFPISRTA